VPSEEFKKAEDYQAGKLRRLKTTYQAGRLRRLKTTKQES